MTDILEIGEGIKYQSSDEKKTYKITTTNVESAPTSPSAIVYDENDNDTVVTSTVMPAGTHTASGDVITLKPLTALTEGHSYRVEVLFTVGSNIHECWFRVACVR